MSAQSTTQIHRKNRRLPQASSAQESQDFSKKLSELSKERKARGSRNQKKQKLKKLNERRISLRKYKERMSGRPFSLRPGEFRSAPEPQKAEEASPSQEATQTPLENTAAPQGFVHADQETISAWYPPVKRDVFILKQLVAKDFKLKYRRSILGVAWSILNPLLMMIIMAIVFTRLMDGRGHDITNFPIYLILGNTAFQLMADSTSTGMSSIITAAPLLKKVRINRYVFPIQKVLFAMVNYAFSFIAAILVMIFFRWVPGPQAIAMIPFLIYIGFFSAGLSLLLSALSVFFRDVMHLWSVVLTAWMYLTPLFYSVAILPRWVYHLEMINPMYLLVTYVRKIWLWKEFPSLELNIACLICAALSFALGYYVFRKLEHKFILFI